jgi:hypothetical protein
LPTLKLKITAQPADPDEFTAQVALIKSSGASFDGTTKTWWHTLAPERLTADTLNPLFQAAAEYHTLIEAIQGDEQDISPTS